jgi:hypothetical protein
MSSYYRVCSAVDVAAESDDPRLLAEAVLLPPWQQLPAELEGANAAVPAAGSGGVQAAASSSGSVQAPAVVAEASAALVAGSISAKLVEAVSRAVLAGKKN